MTFIQWLAVAVFVVSYALIALEHKLKINKSAIALLAGTVLWLFVAIEEPSVVGDHLKHAGSDVFAIIIFLLAAMSLVEVLAHYQFFDVIRGKLFALKLDERKQFLLILVLTFFLSAVIDNLTTTIIMIQIARKFFKDRNLLIAAAGIVIAANAGGAFSPIGDVTTIMLWFAEKFGTVEIIWKGILPSLTLLGVSAALLYRTIAPSTYDATTEIVTKLHRSEKIIITMIFCSFGLPLAVSLLGLPPYIGLIFGLGVVWIFIDAAKQMLPHKTHLSASIEEFIKRTDIPSLKFFAGILLAVAALHSLGILEKIAELIYGASPALGTMIAGNVGLGLLSAILDNVPLTAIAIQLLQTSNSSIWILLALTVGTGGSLLVIGSAAGVVAMGMLKELNFARYFRIAFIPALLGFGAAVGVWALQYVLLGW